MRPVAFRMRKLRFTISTDSCSRCSESHIRPLGRVRRGQAIRSLCIFEPLRGGGVPIRTICSAIQSYRDICIPRDHLPLSFQHAVDMTRRLGLRYLRTDSLCIVQDDVEDWRTRSSKMSDTYSKACITLATTCARQSFYRDRSSHRNEHYQTHSLFDTKNYESPYNIIVCEGLPSVDSSFPTGKLPLLDRARALQERLLSRRGVHFEHLCNDVFPPGTRLELEQRWHTIVRHHSQCKLTYSNDRLPALQGVAQRMQMEHRCTNYASNL